MEKYTCDVCHYEYEKTWSDEEAYKEMYELMPEAIDTPIAVLCDDCHIEFMKWFRTLSKEEKEKMRQDYIKENYQ